MKTLAILLLAALEIGGAYGEASAEVSSIEDDSMVVDLQIEIRTSASAVVVHLAFEDDPALALPLLDRGDGLFGIVTELELKNYVVVFEAVGSPEGLSRPVFLTELGADLDPGDGNGGGPGTDPDDGLSPETRQLGWLALALAAASLSALAFWVLGGRDAKAEESSEEE
ncbi:MAG: hypothetical protein U9N56_00250 [Actinomycetota bacterium]|nr:hypothetical protein [Actinomycetota bacterium]